ncbi:MAG TPA: DUF3426 domain-containing protein [Xanthobacteraceae bacterium]|nr:DUF3426 domain-containing protein [Xanthobacteraceae bacterium]
MLIVCPSCATSYQVEPDSLGRDGRSVRCARCRNVWFATIPTLVSALGGPDDWDVIDTGPRVPSVDNPGQSAASGAGMPANFAAPEDIDVAGLSVEIATERAEQEAEADAVLAEVTQENAVADSPSLVPAQAAASTEAQPSAAVPDIETFAARRARRDALRRRRLKPGWRAAILVLLALNAGIVGWRADIVRLLPQTASLYAAVGLPVNLRGLSFENVRMSRSEHEGVGVLIVEGSIVNVTARPLEVPRLRLAVRNDAKNEIYAWTMQPPRSVLGPGDTLPFRSRLASPPADAREVQVRFFSRRDLVAGLN